jgi:hypothetical protein
MAYPPDARSLGDLFSDLTREITTLLRQEFALFKTEMSDKAARLGRHAAMLVGGGVLAIGGLLTVVASLVLMLVRAGLAPWLAALLVGVAVIGGGAFMAYAAISGMRRVNLAPTETIQTVKETTAWKGHPMS